MSFPHVFSGNPVLVNSRGSGFLLEFTPYFDTGRNDKL